MDVSWVAYFRIYIYSCVLMVGVFFIIIIFPAAQRFSEEHLVPILLCSLGGVLGGGSVPTPTPWDGRSLVGRLQPPLKGGWPLRTPPH